MYLHSECIQQINILYNYTCIIILLYMFSLFLRLQVWHIDTVLRQTIATNSHDSVCNLTCNVSAALSDSWDSPALPCSLTDTLVCVHLMAAHTFQL